MTHLMVHCRGEAPWVTGKVVRDLLDGLNGTRAHVNGHVLLDADGGFLAFALCHACGPARRLLPKPKTEKRKKKRTGTPTSSSFLFGKRWMFSWVGAEGGQVQVFCGCHHTTLHGDL